MGAMFYAEPVTTYDLDVFVGCLPGREFVMVEGVPVQFLPRHVRTD